MYCNNIFNPSSMLSFTFFLWRNIEASWVVRERKKNRERNLGYKYLSSYFYTLIFGEKSGKKIVVNSLKSQIAPSHSLSHSHSLLILVSNFFLLNDDSKNCFWHILWDSTLPLTKNMLREEFEGRKNESSNHQNWLTASLLLFPSSFSSFSSSSSSSWYFFSHQNTFSSLQFWFKWQEQGKEMISDITGCRWRRPRCQERERKNDRKRENFSQREREWEEVNDGYYDRQVSLLSSYSIIHHKQC